jgi:hypothetical protein
MKPFNTYQYLEGTNITDRDKKQVGSKFWNEGKWNNFVAPFLPANGEGSSLVDMGCNAGVFLKLAEDKGFDPVIGVDSDRTSIQRGETWRNKNGGKYKFIHSDINNCIDQLPIVDYTVLANAHYYFTINDWIDYLDQLKFKSRYVIIVTAEKNHINRCWASADVPSIRNYFKDWEEVGFVDELPLDGDPDPRRLWSLCFKSKYLDKVPLESLDSSNHVQDQFYGELDSGKDFKETRYYRILKKYRAKWGEQKLHEWFAERMKVYESLKEEGLMKPILVDHFKHDRILDGNHRYAMMRNLGFKEVFVRYV